MHVLLLATLQEPVPKGKGKGKGSKKEGLKEGKEGKDGGKGKEKTPEKGKGKGLRDCFLGRASPLCSRCAPLCCALRYALYNMCSPFANPFL